MNHPINNRSANLTIDERPRTFEIVSATPGALNAPVIVPQGSQQIAAKMRAFSGHSFYQLAADDPGA